MNLVSIRTNPRNRSDFLESLLIENRREILRLSQRLGRSHSLADECFQGFLLEANRGIDSFIEDDDGRGRNSLRGWCKMKGLLGVLMFIRQEVGEKNPGQPRQILKRITTTLPDETFARIADPLDYAESVSSVLDVMRIIESLSDQDRRIVSLLVFGHDGCGNTIRTASLFGAPRHNVQKDLAVTLGCSKSFVTKRLSGIRRQLEEVA